MGVSTQERQTIGHLQEILGKTPPTTGDDSDASNSQFFRFSTFGSVSVSEGTDDLPDAVFRADAVGPHIPSFYNLRCSDVCVGGFCGNKRISTAFQVKIPMHFFFFGQNQKRTERKKLRTKC